MQLESDGLRLRMLKAVGASRLTIRGEPIVALFVSEFEPVDFGGVVVESHAPLLICRTSDVRRIQVTKDDPVEGLPDEYRVKADDGGDKSSVCSGQWVGFHTIELKR